MADIATDPKQVQANAEAIKEAQRGGIALARANEAETRYRGRKPSFTRDQFSTVCNLLDLWTSVGTIAATTGLSRQTIYRIRDDRASAEAALANWAAKIYAPSVLQNGRGQHVGIQ
jgi:putative DNA-invertase from lambdoid prophage Rac